MVKKLLASILAAAIVLSSATVVLANPAGDYEVTYKTVMVASVNVRSGPGTNYPILGHVSKDDIVAVITTNAGWSTIEFGNGGVGYVSDQFLGDHQAEAPKPVVSTVYVSAATSNVRSGPGLGYPVIGHENGGDALEVMDNSDPNWVEIHYFGGVAFISRSNVTAQAPTTQAPPVQPSSAGPLGTKTVTAPGGALNIRTGPGTTYAVLGVLNNGAQVNVLEVNGGWAKIDYAGGIGYCSDSYLK